MGDSGHIKYRFSLGELNSRHGGGQDVRVSRLANADRESRCHQNDKAIVSQDISDVPISRDRFDCTSGAMSLTMTKFLLFLCYSACSQPSCLFF